MWALNPHYIDLAITSEAKLILTRDKHLLNRANPTAGGGGFRQVSSVADSSG
jgi:hypothetical protein